MRWSRPASSRSRWGCSSVFSEHQPIIATWAQQAPVNLARVAQFAAVSAHVPFHTVVDLFPLYDTPDETSNVRPTIAFGHRRAALADLGALGQELDWQLKDILYHADNLRTAADVMLRYAASLPGLGLAKGGFFLQMAFGISGCLDTHNLTRLKVPLEKFRARRVKNATPKTRACVVQEYHRVIARSGGTRRLWDTWCRHMAREYPGQFSNADDVSAGHLRAFRLG